jgi:hypothetical protein
LFISSSERLDAFEDDDDDDDNDDDDDAAASEDVANSATESATGSGNGRGGASQIDAARGRASGSSSLKPLTGSIDSKRKLGV